MDLAGGLPDGQVRFGGGPSEKALFLAGTSLAAYPTARRDLREPEGETPSGHSTRPCECPGQRRAMMCAEALPVDYA